MTPDSAVPQSERVAAFFQKHRTGLVTLVFTDLVDSTALLHQLGDQAGTTFLRQRRQVLREVLRTWPEAEEIETAGDSFLLVFAKPSDAVRFALVSQGRLRAFSAQSQLAVPERMGIHLGEVVISEHETAVKSKDLYGIQLATCARVMSLAKGGQILMSRGVFDSARQVLKGEDIEGVGLLEWLNHGPYLLKGIEEPVEVCEVREAGRDQAPGPPTSSEKAQRQVRTDEEPVLGWRPAVGQLVPNTKWVLEQKLGEGGFGEVWVGRHQAMKEQRVFKFCFRADRVRSLKREMTLFRLIKERIGDHPNIVSLREVYFDQPPYYVEQDYAQGLELVSWCEAQGGADKIPLETRLEIVAQIADGLQAAHDAGVIHRDVKPGNILISNLRFAICDLQKGSKPETDTPHAAAQSQIANQKSQIHAPQSPIKNQKSKLLVKLTDFGIGQVVSAEALAGVTRAGFTKTMLGSDSSSQTGTQLYMAPELLAGKPASIRSDLYALGVVLYQLLVGDFSRPVTTDWAADIEDSLLQEDLRHCFAGRPEDRFAGAAQLARSLRSVDQRRAALAQQQAEAAQREQLRRQAAQRRTIVLASTGLGFVFLLVAVALAFGLRKAEQQRELAENARVLQRRYAYAADMKAAQAALQQNNRGMTKLLLSRYVPKPGEEDLRGLEWRYLWHQSQGDELFTFAHPAMVKGACLSPDDHYLATAAVDGRVRVWDLVSKTKVQEIAAAKKIGFRSVSFSPDGRWLALPGPQGIEVRETNGWTLARKLDCSSTLLCFAHNEPRLAAIGTNALSWSLSAGSLVSVSNVSSDFGNLACTPDGSRIAFWSGSFSERRPIQVWDIRNGSMTALGAPEFVSGLAISRDGRWLASGQRGGEVCLWQLANGRLVLRFRAHRGLVYALAFSPDSRLLATGGNDQVIHLWECGTTHRLLTLHGHTKEIWSLAFSSDGAKLVSASQDGTAKVWSTQPATAKSPPFALPANSVLVGFVPEQDSLLLWDRQSCLTHFISLPDGQLKPGRDWKRQAQGLSSGLQFFPLAQATLGISSNADLRVWDFLTQAEIQSVRLKPPADRALGLSPDRRWFLGAASAHCQLYDLQHPESVRRFPSSWAEAVFSSDSKWLAYASTNFSVKVWDLAAGREHRTLTGGHNVGICALEFSGDSQWLASGSWDAEVRIWSLASGRPIHPPLRGHLSAVGPLRFSLDSKSLLSEGDDFCARVWSVATGQEVLLFEEVERRSLQGEVQNGRYLVYQQREGPVRVTPLPSLAEIDACERSAAADQQQR